MRARLLTRELIELPERFAAFAAKTEEKFGRVHQEITDFKAETNERFGRIETTLTQIRNEISNLRGTGATSAAFRKASAIALSMGLEYVRPLTNEHLLDMIQNVDHSAFQRGDLASFIQADLVIECQDPQGRTCYIATEISYTVDERDTSRAIRNAGFLSAFTGNPAFPAVIGLRMDNRALETIDSGQVFWHRLDDTDLAAR